MPSPHPERPADVADADVVAAAMSDLTSWVYDARITSFMRWRVLTHFHLDDPRGSGRAACVGVFKDLKHFAVAWDSDDVCQWAIRRGWVPRDVQALRELSDGVRDSVRFHTAPYPFPRDFVHSWLAGRPLRASWRRDAPVRIKSCCRGTPNGRR